MAQTYFNLDKDYVINHYRFKPIKDGFLLTNDFGFWVYLNKEEFNLVRYNKLIQNQALFSLLKDKGFVIANDNFEKSINDFRHRTRSLFRGTYYHTIYLDNKNLNEEEIDGNVKKIVDFILQTPSRELIVEFKGNFADKSNIIKNFVDQFDKKIDKRITFKIETDLASFNDDILEFLINNKFDVWFPLRNVNFSEETYSLIKEFQRRHGINFYLDITKEILGQEQKIIDYFIENNFKSFFIRKTDNTGYEEFIDFWKKVIDYAYDINKKNGKIVFYEGYTPILLKKILDIHDTFYPELNSLCTGAIVSELGYTLDGNIYANGESVGIEIFNIGNVNSNYSSVISNEESLSLISSSINNNPQLDNNAFNPYIGNCPICNYKENGNIILKNPSQRISTLTSMFEHLFERVIFDDGFLEFIQLK